MEISICFDFKGVGHATITLIPALIKKYKQTASGCKKFDLLPGDYQIRAQGVVNIPGAVLSVKDNTGTLIASNDDFPVGQFSRSLDFTLQSDIL